MSRITITIESAESGIVFDHTEDSYSADGEGIYRVSVPESICRILKTPKGDRVMRPGYGSTLHELIDRPFDDEFKMDLVAGVYTAVEANEPRIVLDKVKAVLFDSTKGQAKIEIEYQLKEG